MNSVKDLFKVVCTDTSGKITNLQPTVTENKNEIKLVVKKEQLDQIVCDTVRVESALTTVSDTADGYMFFPTNFDYGVVKCNFTKRENTKFVSEVSAMPVCGICENKDSLFVHVRSMDSDARFIIEYKDGIYTVTPEFLLEGDPADEDIVIVYTKMPYATYSDMARFYRKYQMDIKGCVPLKERIKGNEILEDAAKCLELRIRMGWKPQPTPVRRQTLENEPPMHIACDIDGLNKIIDAMKEKGVKNAEICLVGWGPGGHDGRFPQHYPCDERFGSDEELRAFIKKAQSYGYLVVCHSNCKGAYEIAKNWDASLLSMYKDENGKIKPWLRADYAKDGLQGGDPWHVCAKPAYEHYAVEMYPVIRDYGFEGMHYVDEISACAPIKCCDKVHPVSRKQALEYYRKIAKLSKELFGGFQTEAWFDFINSDIDYVLYTSTVSNVNHDQCGLFDELIPFWALVYHGIVMSNATSDTINYPIKDKISHLKMIECGSRPTMYFNSKFCGRDWMGKEDLYSDSDEGIKIGIDAIKTAEDEYEKLQYLQYEFMNNHEKLRDGVYRVTYSDGTVVTVDYNTGEYTVMNIDRNVSITEK